MNRPQPTVPNVRDGAVRNPVRFAELSSPRQRLVRLCQMINHGNIESLEVRDTEPIFDPMPLAMKDVKLDSDEGPRPEVDLLDFELSIEVRRLMRQLDALITGTIEQILVRGGIARRIVLRATATRAPHLCGPAVETAHQQTNTSDQPNGGSNHER